MATSDCTVCPKTLHLFLKLYISKNSIVMQNWQHIQKEKTHEIILYQSYPHLQSSDTKSRATTWSHHPFAYHTVSWIFTSWTQGVMGSGINVVLSIMRHFPTNPKP